MAFEESEDKRVEKDPLVLEKVIKKGAHVLAGDHRGKESKDPFTSEDVGLHVELLHAAVQLRQIGRYQQFNHLAVLEQAEQLVPVDLLHVAIFNECDEKPESESFGAMEQ